MTQDATPTGVETSPATVTPPRPDIPARSDDGDGTTSTTTPARPGSRRGGRGRGGRGRGTATRSNGGDGDTAGGVEIDIDAQPGETEHVANETIVDGDRPAQRPRTSRTRAPRAKADPDAAEATSAAAPGETDDDTGDDVAPTTGARRRRRRGGRGRGRGGSGATATDAEGAATAADVSSDRKDDDGASTTPARRPRARTASASSDAAAETAVPTDADASDDDAGDGSATGTRRRRRRGGRGRGRKAGSTATEEAAGATEGSADEKPTRARTAARSTTAKPSTRTSAKPTATRTRSRRSASEEEPTSTRLKRRTQSRQIRRRRDVMPLVERVTDKLMVVTEHGERDQIAVLEERDLVQHYVTRQGARSMVGNVYLGRVQNVLPGMEAAFVDVGRGRNAVLYAGEVNWSPEDLEGQAPRIERVLKSGQSVLVQVTKDPIGGKGARLTAQISLPGRYLVLAPNSNVTGISRRLPDEERKRLKAIYKKIKPDQHGLIVRTAAEGATEEALAEDLDRLVATWAEIEKRSKKAKAPAVLYEEPELTLRVVRDLFTDEEFRELVTDSPRIYELITNYLRDIAPDVLSKVRLHQGKLSAFEEFHIVEQIHKGLDRKVWLPSGGYLVIDRTEALTVIDVNTGKSVGKTNLEETVANTNIEAAREVARQLRLRDIGGMIVIDFIDMLLEQNKRKVIDAMKEAMAKDKTRSQVFDISPLGLLEVTRKRVSGGLLESFSETCPTCEGRGVLLTYDVN